jgi:hypothetical protein
MDPEQLSANRCQLALFARQKRRRRVPRELPCSWRPSEVINPDDNQPFTDSGAWEFIAQLLENAEQSVDVITLERPAGQSAFVMTCDLPTGRVYIKVHYGHGPSILGRSFHYSEHQPNHER